MPIPLNPVPMIVTLVTRPTLEVVDAHDEVAVGQGLDSFGQ